jgi:hypothetical protein
VQVPAAPGKKTVTKMSRAFVPAVLSARSLLARSPRVARAFALACTVAAIAMPRAVSAVGFNAEVTIVEPINITELTNLDFGNILPPSAGTRQFTISALDASTSIAGGGTGGQFLGGHNRGQYSITGADGPYTLTPSFGGCTDPVNLQLIGITLNGAFVLDETVDVGGTLQVKSTAVPGAYTCNYSLAANY